MTRDNQIQEHAHGQWSCLTCSDRLFVNSNSIKQHVRSAAMHYGEWCERCSWLFVSPDAKQDHLEKSIRHNECPVCTLDFAANVDLVQHMEDDHFYGLCRPCNVYHKLDVLGQHSIDEHFACRNCHRRFSSENERAMHMQTHLPRASKCPGCPRLFPTYSANLLHLEYGTCESGANREWINRIAQTYGLHYSPGYYDDWIDRFGCDECDSHFTLISGLYQHCESPACPVDPGKSLSDLRDTIDGEVFYIIN